VPGYLAKAAELRQAGIHEVLVYCVNDGAVMKAWAKDQKVDGSPLITLLADTRGEFTKAIGMFMNHPGPKDALGTDRCKRFVLICEDGVVKRKEVSEGPDDPAGDNEPDGPVTAKTRVENILKLLQGLKFPPLKADPTPEQTSQIPNAKKFVADAMQTSGIVVFSKTYCPNCVHALGVLSGLKTDMVVHQLDTLGEPANGPVQQELEKITGQLTVPQVFVDGKFIGGRSEIDELQAAGTLGQTMLQTDKGMGA